MIMDISQVSLLSPKGKLVRSCGNEIKLKLQHAVVFVCDLIVTLGLARLQVSFVLHHSSRLVNQIVPTKVTKSGRQESTPGTRIPPATQAMAT